jgi:hypothetical protein
VDVIACSHSGRSLKVQEAPDKKNHLLEITNANFVKGDRRFDSDL